MKPISLINQAIDLGPIKVNIPLIALGNGPKTIALVFGIHGVETSGFLLLKALYERRGDLKNKIKIVPSANPSGLLLANRFGQLDLPVNTKDPNRSFPGKKEGGVQERISALVLKSVSDCDFVLDIHNFSNLGEAFPILSLEGLQINRKTKQMLEKELVFLNSLEANFAFFIDQKQASQRGFSGTLNEALNQRLIPNLGFELPSPEFFRQEDLEILTTKIIKAINNLGAGKATKSKPPTFLATEVKRSEQCGMFFPTIKPPVKVKKGAILGTIFDPFQLKTIEIKSPKKGILFILKRKDFVRVGEFLFEIGWEIKPNFDLPIK